MKKSKFTESQIAFVLKQTEGETAIAVVCLSPRTITIANVKAARKFGMPNCANRPLD